MTLFFLFSCILLLLFSHPHCLCFEQLIRKKTKKLNFSPGLYDPVDAQCVVCLSAYVDGDALRMLPCQRA